jgi:hypothetical protein
MNATAPTAVRPSWTYLCRNIIREICCAMPMQLSSPVALPEQNRIHDLPGLR